MDCWVEVGYTVSRSVQAFTNHSILDAFTHHKAPLWSVNTICSDTLRLDVIPAFTSQTELWDLWRCHGVIATLRFMKTTKRTSWINYHKCMKRYFDKAGEHVWPCRWRISNRNLWDEELHNLETECRIQHFSLLRWTSLGICSCS